MNLYICIYFLMILLMLIFRSNHSKKNAILILTLILSIVVGIRSNIGTDYNAYLGFYNEAQILTFQNILVYSTYETTFGFSFLMSIFKTIGISSPIFFYILISIITSYNIYRATIKFEIKLFFLSFVIYFCYFFLNHQLNTVRHGIMVSYVWVAFSCISLNDKKNFYKYIILGALFHSLALLFLPFYYLLQCRINNKILLLLLLLIIISIMSPFVLPLLLKIIPMLPFVNTDRIMFYITDYYIGIETSGFRVSLGMLLNIFLVLIMYLKKEDLRTKNIHFNVIFNALVISVFVAFVFHSVSIFVERISGTLNVALPLIIPLIIYEFSRKNKLRIAYFVLVFIYCFLILNTNANKVNEWGKYQFIPYKSLYD